MARTKDQDHVVFSLWISWLDIHISVISFYYYCFFFICVNDFFLLFNDISSVYISYGGLLMCLEGDFRHLQNISLGENLYLLMRK